VTGATALGDIALPAMLLKRSALENNVAVMAQYAADHGFVLAPHGKTTMAPKLFRRQLDAGAWGITVANMAQAAIAYDAGAERVLVANEVVSRADAQAIVDALSTPAAPAVDMSRSATSPASSQSASSQSATSHSAGPHSASPGLATSRPASSSAGASAGAGRRELYCLVDSVAGVELLDHNLGHAGLGDQVGVFVELGVAGGRTGARTQDEAVAVAGAVGASAHLRLVGVEGYEGLLAPDRSPESLAKVDEYLDGLRRLTIDLADREVFPDDEPILVSAGGSRFFDRVAAVLGEKAQYGGHDVRLVVRSGCYVVHDHGTYAATSPLARLGHHGPGLKAALEVWADVLSVPEPGLVIVGLGRRDVSYDLELPVTLAVARRETGRVEPFTGMALSQLNDQHGYLHLGTEQGPVVVGDRIGFGISHPCTAIDNWRSMLLVNDDYEVLDLIVTFFH
jgi:D-serine dehydratase